MPGPMNYRRCVNTDCNCVFPPSKNRCPSCYEEWYEIPTYASSQVARIHYARLVVNGGAYFIAKENLDMYEDYYGAEVGDVVAFQGPGGSPIYFEIAGDIEGWGPQPVPAWLLLRVDDQWPKDWPVLDVDPSEAVILARDKAEEEGGSRDEAS